MMKPTAATTLKRVSYWSVATLTPSQRARAAAAMKMRMARTLAELFIVEEKRKWGKGES
jgi:hypothetical protein